MIIAALKETIRIMEEIRPGYPRMPIKWKGGREVDKNTEEEESYRLSPGHT